MARRQESCLGECCRRLRMRFHRFEGEILPTDPPDFTSAAYWLAHPVHHPGNFGVLAHPVLSIELFRQSMTKENCGEPAQVGVHYPVGWQCSPRTNRLRVQRLGSLWICNNFRTLSDTPSICFEFQKFPC